MILFHSLVCSSPFSQTAGPLVSSHLFVLFLTDKMKPLRSLTLCTLWSENNKAVVQELKHEVSYCVLIIHTENAVSLLLALHALISINVRAQCHLHIH